MTWLWVAAAGAAGSLSRWFVQGIVMRERDPLMPYGTLIVNVSGCFLIGLMFALLTGRLTVAPSVRVGLLVGLLGGYTTFSSFSFETIRLMEDGALAFAGLNIVASVIGGIGATWLGLALGRAL